MDVSRWRRADKMSAARRPGVFPACQDSSRQRSQRFGLAPWWWKNCLSSATINCLEKGRTCFNNLNHTMASATYQANARSWQSVHPIPSARRPYGRKKKKAQFPSIQAKRFVQRFHRHPVHCGRNRGSPIRSFNRRKQIGRAALVN